jgi:glutaredoxin 3
VKEFLSHHNITYIEFDVSNDFHARDEMIMTYDSMSTPTVVIGDTVLRGFNEETASELERIVTEK